MSSYDFADIIIFRFRLDLDFIRPGRSSLCWAFPYLHSRNTAVRLFSGLLQKCADPRWRHTRVAEVWRDRDICEALSSHGNTVILEPAF